MNPAVTMDARTERTVRRFIARLSGQFEVTGAILFGSRARQTHQPESDADVAVLLRGSHARWFNGTGGADAQGSHSFQRWPPRPRQTRCG